MLIVLLIFVYILFLMKIFVKVLKIFLLDVGKWEIVEFLVRR